MPTSTHGNRCRKTGIIRRAPYLSNQSGDELRQRIDAFIDQKIDEWQRTVPYAKHFESGEINLPYYRRHLIETAWRIRLLRVAECKAIAEIAKESPEAAQIWANYEREEMVHDTLFISDLEKIGGSVTDFEETEPYLSTKLLAGFFQYLLDHEGPLGIVAYSYLVEYVNVRLDPGKIDGLKKGLGPKLIKGQISHSHTDTFEDHPGEVWQVLRHLIRSDADIAKLYTYIEEHQTILAMYFAEVYQEFGSRGKTHEVPS